MKFAPRMTRFKASPSQMASARVRDMVANGHDIVKLTAGEPDFPTPDNAKAAAIACMDANEIRYTPINGLPEMRQAVQFKFKRDNNLDYELDQIAVGSGHQTNSLQLPHGNGLQRRRNHYSSTLLGFLPGYGAISRGDAHHRQLQPE